MIAYRRKMRKTLATCAAWLLYLDLKDENPSLPKNAELTPMLLSHALRLAPKSLVALTGAGGKTTLMFRLADESVAAERLVVTTMTTHIFAGQMAHAPASLVLTDEAQEQDRLTLLLAKHRHVLLAGEGVVEEDKVQGVSPEILDALIVRSDLDIMIVEADGSRRRALKAPAPHEPVIPNCATVVIPVVGLDILDQPLTTQYVHRPELVAALAGVQCGSPIGPEVIAAVLAHPQGGGKGAPPAARLVPFLNKAEDEVRLAAARRIARLLLDTPRIDSVLIGRAQASDPVSEVWSHCGAVVLAAGQGRRFGALKQVLPWRDGEPIVAHVVRQALACPDIDRVAVVTGAGQSVVLQALAILMADGGGSQDAFRDRHARLQTVHEPDWALGQSRSVQAGLAALERMESGGPLGSAVFLLADQPGVTPELLTALVQRHRETLAPVVAPRYQGQRGTPVLFDRATFAEFSALTGDVGARSIISARGSEVAWLDWPTAEILQDIDLPDDYATVIPGG